MSADIAPNQTVYCNNLNEKLKVEELKKSLYHVFSQFGVVIEVHASKSLKRRGQAFIVFEHIDAATKAVREMSGFNFYSKPMKVAFAKVKSDTVAKRDGTFVPRAPKRKGDEAPENNGVKRPKKQPPPPSSLPPSIEAEASIQLAREGEPQPPNPILFVQGLPNEADVTMLEMLFTQYDGFERVRLIAGKPGIAFIDFGTEFQAGKAKDALQKFKITPEHPMLINYARQ